MNFNEEHEKLLLERKELYNEKRELEYKIRLNKTNLENLEIKIEKNCLFFNKKHDWMFEREIGPYGGLFRTCKNCGIEK